MLHVPKLSRSDFESWLCTNPLQRLESLVIFKAPELTLDTIMWLLEELEAITELGDLHSMDFAKASGEVRKTWLIFRKIRIWTFQVRKLHQEVKKKEWDVTLVDSSQGSDTEERDFGKLQSLHWFVCLNNLIPEHRYCFIGTHFDSRFYLTPSEGYKQGHTSGAPRQHYYHWSQKKIALEICPQHLESYLDCMGFVNLWIVHILPLPSCVSFFLSSFSCFHVCQNSNGFHLILVPGFNQTEVICSILDMCYFATFLIKRGRAN